MIAVVQRVLHARVEVASATVGEIQHGVLVLAAVQADDTPADAEWTAAKLLALRIFRNGDKHFDLDVAQAAGGLLLVSNFTVAAETKKRRRPSLDGAASPDHARALFDHLVATTHALAPPHVPVATGQ